MQQSYKIYFDGEIAGNFNPEEVKKRAQIVFKLSEEKIVILFDGTPHILKENLSAAECEQYLNQLLHIGLVAKSDPLLHAELSTQQEPQAIVEEIYTEPDNTTYYNPEEITEPEPKIKKASKVLPLALLAIIVAGGGVYAWQSGLIELPFLNDDIIDQPIAIAPKPQTTPVDVKAPEVEPEQSKQNQRSESTEEVITAEIQPEKSLIIEECTNPEVTVLLEKVLAQGLPQLVQRTSPDVNLTIQTYDNNQELYFDEARNKRLCGVLSKYSIDSPNISPDAENPTVVYEIIYEIQREDDQSIRLSTFRQKIISSNLQSNENIN
ncbi:hypothetical protein [Wohlfahrtiimonas populi]|uniref:hypothetical protein n=1 Tax=Wohlfahrtiimonas populi TaxID=1940240 RepID=UPI00098D3114|nr:hypothetical protein [Wohlfahrtiimonas populi]